MFGSDGVGFPEAELPLEGGCLYLCSDGLTEAGCETGEALGSEGVQRLIESFACKPLAERIEAIAARASELRLRDDLTLLGVSDEREGRER